MSIEQLKHFERPLDNPFIGVKYTALKNALYHYYCTLSGLTGGLGFAFFSLPAEDGEETEFDNDNYQLEGYHDSFINSIVSFHHFIELHIKEVLSSYDELLAADTKKLDKAKAVVSYLESGKIEPSDRSVDFMLAIDILKELKKNCSLPDKKYKLKPEHDFLLDADHIETIFKLYEYRNATLHKADIILPYLPFDYFVTQHVIPLVKRVLDSEPHYEIHSVERPVACGLSIIDEILKIKFPLSEVKREASNLFYKTAERLAHLKELGRASYHIPVSAPLNLLKAKLKSAEKKKSSIEYEFIADYKQELKRLELAEDLADIEKDKPRVHAKHNCPCCGASTLLTHWKIEMPAPMPKAFKVVYRAECSFCTYHLSRSMGDPFWYKITEEELFPDDDDDIGWPFRSMNPSLEELDEYEG